MSDKSVPLLETLLASDLRELMAVSHIVLANNQLTSRFIETHYDMPVNAWSTLYAIAHFPGILAKEIEILFPRPQNSVSRAIRLLESRGLIERVTNQEDTRAKHLYPTDEGTRLLEVIEKRVAQRQEEIFGHLTASERGVFLDLCKKIIESEGLANSSAFKV